MQISRSRKQVAALLLLGLSLAGCGFTTTPSQPNGKSATLNLSLKTVPTVRSITISPARASFANCTGGKDRNNTKSTGGRLGYPNGICWVGEVDPIGVFPIKVTNTGIASFVYINGSSATPSDAGNSWSLCNVGPKPAAICNGYKNRKPGVDQYIVRDFGPDGSNNTGLTGSPQCDRAFGPHGKCWATLGASQTEGFELIGPFAATDAGSTNWTVSITWTPVPKEGN
jgi:hypothetical protein